jgi:ribosomal protein S18 acetylase RimI-like enzyme
MNNNWTLRRGEARDLPFIYRQERRYIEDFEADQFGPWQNSMEQHLMQWLNNLPRTSVIESDDEQAGYIAWQKKDNTAVVASVNVESLQRRSGIATRLMEQFEKEAVCIGVHIFQVGVVHGNPAEQMYIRMGYRRTSQDANYTILQKQA